MEFERQYTLRPMTRSGIRLGLVTVLAGLAILARTGFPSAHEIPTEVTVHAFIRPEGHRLRLLVRVPLKAMRDVNFPTRGPGFLDLSRADATLREAAVVWIGNGVTVYEDDRLLGAP